MNEENKFKVDEKVLTVLTNNVGIIKEIVKRPEDYDVRYS